MRAKHWIAVALFVGLVAYSQAYALTTQQEPEPAPQAAAEVEEPRAQPGPQQVVSQEVPAEPQPADEPVAKDPVAPAPQPEPELPRVDDLVDEVGTLIVGFKQNLGETLMEAIVRAAGATPVDTVSAPGTLVVSVDEANRTATIAQLESNPLVAYIAVPAVLQQVS